MKRPCIFFDRDGIVNEPPVAGYVEHWDDFHLQPGFVAALRVTLSKGYPAVVVTHQEGVAKGLYTEGELQEIHGLFRAQLRTHGVDVLDIFYCPHLAADECSCRKPGVGMLQQAAEKHGLDLSKSWMVVERETDVEAARNAGCRTIRVCMEDAQTRADIRVEHVDGIAAILEQELEPCV